MVDVCDKAGKSVPLDIFDNRPWRFFTFGNRIDLVISPTRVCGDKTWYFCQAYMTSPAIFVGTSAGIFTKHMITSYPETDFVLKLFNEKLQHILTLQNSLQYIANIYTGDWVVEISK